MKQKGELMGGPSALDKRIYRDMASIRREADYEFRKRHAEIAKNRAEKHFDDFFSSEAMDREDFWFWSIYLTACAAVMSVVVLGIAYWPEISRLMRIGQ